MTHQASLILVPALASPLSGHTPCFMVAQSHGHDLCCEANFIIATSTDNTVVDVLCFLIHYAQVVCRYQPKFAESACSG